MQKEDIQERLYEFPYHYLPINEGETIWRISKSLFWGYEYLAVLETIKRIVYNCQPNRVLDFGCGDGRLINELTKMGICEIIGVDISERALLFAKTVLHNNPNVYFYSSISSIDTLFVPVDVIIAMEVFEHIPSSELRKILSQLRQVLKPDGFLIVSVPTINTPVNPKHYQHFSLESFSKICEDMFAIIECRFIHKIGWLSEWIRKIIINRFFIANYNGWLRMTTWAYKRLCMEATQTNGKHMICSLKPKIK